MGHGSRAAARSTGDPKVLDLNPGGARIFSQDLRVSLLSSDGYLTLVGVKKSRLGGIVLATETGERCFTSPMITLVRRVLYYFTYLLSVSSPGLTSIEHECLVDRGSYYKRIFTTNKSNTNVKSLNLERLGLEQRK